MEDEKYILSKIDMLIEEDAEKSWLKNWFYEDGKYTGFRSGRYRYKQICELVHNLIAEYDIKDVTEEIKELKWDMVAGERQYKMF